MEPSEYAYEKSLKGGNMCLNRFSIDEDAAFELSGVHYLKKTSAFGIHACIHSDAEARETKGKGFLSFDSFHFMSNPLTPLRRMNHLL